ncbi:MAG: NADH-quinone oxidoreductase subunit M [Thermoplasmataceae archaeon]
MIDLAAIFALLSALSILTFFAGRHSSAFAMISSAVVMVATAFYVAITMESYTGGMIGRYSIVLNSAQGISFSIGISGFTAPLLLAASIVFPLALFLSRGGEYGGTFYGLMMISETGLYGVLISRDFMFFYIFWEVVLVPVFFLITLYGGVRRQSVSLKFFVYTHIGSAFILLSIFSLYAYYFAIYGTFSMQISSLTDPAFVSKIPYFWQIFVIAGLMIGFLVKLPTFPIHSWLPDTYDTAPYPVTVIIAGGLSLMGGYGLFGIMLRMGTLFPLVSLWFIIMLSLISLVYFSLTAMYQYRIKRMMAYASAGSMGFVTLAFASGIMEKTGTDYVLAISGGMFQIFAHSLIIALLFASIFYIRKVSGNDSIFGLGGIYREAPLLSSITLGGLLASLGLPGLAGFVGEFSILGGTFQTIGYLIFVVIFSMIITASYHIWFAQRSLYGPYNEGLGRIRDLSRSEFIVLGSLLFFLLFIGVFPSLFFNLFSSYVGGLL